jgi:hypothetical protein
VIASNEWEWAKKEAVLALFEVASSYFLEGTEENHEKPQSV